MNPSIYKPWYLRALDAMRSRNVAERESLFVGWNEDNGSPFFLTLNQLAVHIYVEGRSSAGKTSLALCPLIEQIAQRQDRSIIVIDVKGDSMELFGAVKAGPLPVRWFINRDGWSSHTFNLFENHHWGRLDPMQKAACLGTALGTLSSMAGYGVQWYEGAGFEVMTRVFERHHPRNIAHLAKLIEEAILDGRSKTLHSEIRRAGLQAQLDCGRMGRIQALGQIGNPYGIQLGDLFERPQVLYLCLPSGGNHSMAGAVCRLFLGALFDAAAFAKRNNPVMVVIDEATSVITGTLMQELITQSRSLGIHWVIANQTRQDMQTKDKDFRHTLLSCCCTHWHFGEPVKEIQLELAKTGGTYKAIDVSETTARHPITRSWTETSITRRVVDMERLPLNEVKRVGANPKLTFVTASGDDGLSQYQGFTQVVEVDHHITKDEYERRKLILWPEAVPGCIVTRKPGLITDTRDHDDDNDEPPPVPRITRPKK